MKRWISSADLRLFAKQSVRRPRSTRSAISRAASPSAERADAELLVEERRVPERDRPLGARRGVVLDHGHVEPGQRARKLAGVGDRRRGEQELRVGAVDAREAAQPPQDVADMRAEDAAVDVRLVDHHVGEVREHVAPAVVVGQDADVEHVRVREHEVRPLADLPAPLGLRVAVVDRRPDARHLQVGERAELVLGERLRRVEVDRALLRLGGERVENREVEGERLPARRAGDDGDVLASRGCIPGVALVLVELGDASGLERSAHACGCSVIRERRGASLARGLGADVRELLPLEDPGPRRQLDRHRTRVAFGVQMSIPRCLTIAGSDSGGAAGIQADLKAFAAAGCYGMTAIVALTAQNTVGVDGRARGAAGVRARPARGGVLDIGVDAAKTGMLSSAADRRGGRGFLGGHPVPLVVDPVMIASSGRACCSDGRGRGARRSPLPARDRRDPELMEAEALAGPGDRRELAERARRARRAGGARHRRPRPRLVDQLFDGRTHTEIPVERHDVAATHGAGCTHSATLAARLARGLSLEEAARGAAAAASRAVAQGLPEIGAGEGPVDVLGLAR